MQSKPICVGPWGSEFGEFKWTCNEDGSGAIKQIVIRHGDAIDSILFKIERKGGEIFYSNKFGGNGGHQTTKIDIDWPYEHLTSISGHYGNFRGHVVIRSLRFITNVTKYGPIGSADGTPFSLPMEGGVIVGFLGKSGQFLDAIGVYLKPTDLNFPCVTNFEESVKEAPLPSPTMIKELVSPPGVGPWGGIGGKPFDDGIFHGIKQIVVHRENDVVHSILIEYDRNGQSVVSQRHGGPGGDITHRIKLDYPNEYLIALSGYYGAFKGHEVIKSILFYTTKGRYGPFGEEAGIFFTSSDVQAKIVGFHGRNGAYLDAIGVLREYF